MTVLSAWSASASEAAAPESVEAVSPSQAFRVDLADLERSYWLHASLGQRTVANYWFAAEPVTEPPTRAQIAHAARLLVGPYGANRLYLIYHKEIPAERAREVFKIWRDVTPPEVELVPALVLRMYDKDNTLVFDEAEIAAWAEFFKAHVHPKRMAVYDVYTRPDQGPGPAILSERFPGGLIHVGQQPATRVEPPFSAAVQDTWSGMCHGTRNEEDWLQPGFGAETLRAWVEERNACSHPIAWNLVAVAWDYEPTERGGFPGYDDARKNMPLPADRNRLAANLILDTARPEVMAGFSADLFIIHANSRVKERDGDADAFYATLREGRPYRGYFAEPVDEIAALFRALRDGDARAVRERAAFARRLEREQPCPTTRPACP
jgi:hypothetical protein